jgi:sporulation protein YqfC
MSIKEQLISLEDSARRHTTITVCDNKELYMENCRCVRNYDDNFITLSSLGLNVKISGAPLVLENFGTFGVKITGRIHSLTLEEEE